MARVAGLSRPLDPFPYKTTALKMVRLTAAPGESREPGFLYILLCLSRVCLFHRIFFFWLGPSCDELGRFARARVSTFFRATFAEVLRKFCGDCNFPPSDGRRVLRRCVGTTNPRKDCAENDHYQLSPLYTVLPDFPKHLLHWPSEEAMHTLAFCKKHGAPF